MADDLDLPKISEHVQCIATFQDTTTDDGSPISVDLWFEPLGREWRAKIVRPGASRRVHTREMAEKMIEEAQLKWESQYKDDPTKMPGYTGQPPDILYDKHYKTADGKVPDYKPQIIEKRAGDSMDRQNSKKSRTSDGIPLSYCYKEAMEKGKWVKRYYTIRVDMQKGKIFFQQISASLVAGPCPDITTAKTQLAVKLMRARELADEKAQKDMIENAQQRYEDAAKDFQAELSAANAAKAKKQ